MVDDMCAKPANDSSIDVDDEEEPQLLFVTNGVGPLVRDSRGLTTT